MTGPAQEVQGLADFRRELRAVDRALPRELTKVHQSIARIVQPLAQARAASMGGMQAHFAAKIRARATQTTAAIGVLPAANAAFWGAKKHTGWYAGKPGRPQFPAWVGDNWDAGEHGQGPYAINDAIADSLPVIDSLYGRMLDDLTHRAFPEP